MTSLRFIVAVLFIVLAGCQAPGAPRPIAITASSYDVAFEAAVDVAGDAGLIASLRDRRSGVIETSPEPAASLFEPWRGDNYSLVTAIENTLSVQRRRARFAFTPDNGHGEGVDSPIDGPDLLTGEGPIDLTTTDGDLILDVEVIVERAHRTGERRSSWSRRLSTRSRRAVDGTAGEEWWLGTVWTPVGRDTATETRLLSAIRKRLGPSMADR